MHDEFESTCTTSRAKRLNWECLCLSQRDFVPFYRFLIHYSCCSCSVFAPIRMCLFYCCYLFCSLSIDYYSKFLFRLNGFCFIHSLKREVKRFSWLLPIRLCVFFYGVGTLLCFHLKRMRKKLDVKNWPDLAFNSIKTLASLHFVGVAVHVLFFLLHHVNQFKMPPLIGEFIEWLPFFISAVSLLQWRE